MTEDEKKKAREAEEARLRAQAEAQQSERNNAQGFFASLLEGLLKFLTFGFYGSDGNDRDENNRDEAADRAVGENYQSTQRSISDERRAFVALAASKIGQREVGNNCGEIVQWSGAASGQPWCGGFVNRVYDEYLPGLFDQGDFLRARSFEDEAAQHGAFKPFNLGYQPKPGDTVIFKRGGGGHVGIVQSVENGVVTYISGNYGNAVKPAHFSLDKPDPDLLGYVDITALAANKGISVDREVTAVTNTPAPAVARQHRASDIMLG